MLHNIKLIRLRGTGLKDNDIHEVVKILRKAVRQWQSPAVTIVSQREGDPYKVLVSCILSLRTKDETTGPASERLFRLADTPQAMADLAPTEIEKAIYPVGFYRNKAVQIREISRQLVTDYDGRVPD